MRFLKFLVIVCFIVVTITFGKNWYKEQHSDKGIVPEIEFKNDIIDVTVEDYKKQLMQDVTAKDEQDGDLSSQVVVESISKFVDKKEHISNITYAVSDSDHNVAKKSRKVRFTDYKSPKFTLSQPLCFNLRDEMNLPALFGANDVVDGNISARVKVYASSATTFVAGQYSISVQVTNSLGDTAKLKTAIHVDESNRLAPKITLDKSLVYLKVGDEFKPNSYVKGVTDANDNKLDKKSVSVSSSSVNMKKPGTYSVEYTAKTETGIEGHTYLIVVVEE